MATDDQKQDTTGTENLNAQLLSMAEQLGRMAGTIEGTAESWMKNGVLTEQLTSLRDNANKLLSKVSGMTTGRGASKTPAQKPVRRASATADPVHAPGKKHRKPAPRGQGPKKSNQPVAKLRAAQGVRRRTPR